MWRAGCFSGAIRKSLLSNGFPGTVEEIVSDKLVSEVVIRTAAGTVTSTTTGSVQRINLTEGDTVFAIIKATEVSVEKEKPVTSRWERALHG